MATISEYAQLANRVYNRTGKNRTPVAPGWTELQWVADRDLSGFSAGVYQLGADIVISYTGTNEKKVNDFIVANFPAAAPLPSAQVWEAMELYLEVKNSHPGANITFTGHSLGGGLASMMAVFFDRPATIFDPAPFEIGALSPVALATYAGQMLAYGYSDPAFNVLINAVGNTFSQRETQVTGYWLQGEALGFFRAGIPTIMGAGHEVAIGPQTILEGSVSAVAASSLDLHSMTMLAAMLTSQPFADAVRQSPNLLALLFDGNLYNRDPQSSRDPNFIDRLYIAQVSSPSRPLLDRFASDLMRLNAGTGMTAQTAVLKALTIASMEYFYFNTPTNTSSLFTAVDGGIQFKYSDIPQSPFTLKSPRLLGDAIRPFLSEDEWQAIGPRLETRESWSIQSGSSGMTWTASGATADDAAIGGAQTDVLDGGAGDDIFVGGAGQDYLTGDAGSDRLIGGIGVDVLDGGVGNDEIFGGADADIYQFSGDFGTDTIHDLEGLIQIQGVGTLNSIDIRKLGDGTWVSASNKVTFNKSGSDLVIGVEAGATFGTILIKDWVDGSLGITLGSTPLDKPSTVILTGDFIKKKIWYNQPGEAPRLDYEYDAYGNFVSDGDAPGASDSFVGSPGADLIWGLAGDDVLRGYAGNDFLDGGAGADLLYGGIGADTVLGGSGGDLILGSSRAAAVDSQTGQVYYNAHFGHVSDAPNGYYHDVWDHPENYLIEGKGWASWWDQGWMRYAVPNEVDEYGLQPWYYTENVLWDRVDGDQGNVIDGGSGNDSIGAGTGNDLALGGDGDDQVFGMAGADTLIGGAGKDVVYGDSQPFFLVDGSGNPLADGPVYDGSPLYSALADQAGDQIDGGDGNDTLVGQGGADVVFGGTGNDRLWGDWDRHREGSYAFDGNDFLDGGDGNDTISGGGRADQLLGGLGDDFLFGDAGGASNAPRDGDGNDTLDGDAGNDQLVGGGANDLLYGGIGNDSIFGDHDDAGIVPANMHGNDTLYGGSGDDYLYGHGGTDLLDGGDGNDMLDGGIGDDALSGGVGSDTLSGAVGNDTLSGGDGNDRLDGGDGNDMLIGGAGADDLRGDAGNDTYVISAAESSDGVQADTITDTSGNDVLQLGGVSTDAIQVTRGSDGTLALVFSPTQSVNLMGGVTSSVATVIADGGPISLQQLVGSRLATVVSAGSDRQGGRLMGGAKNDTLAANHGATSISGGQGADSIALNSGGGSVVSMLVGDGTDQITAARRSASAGPNDPAPQNVLQLGSGFDGAQVRLFKVGAQSFVLSLNDKGDGIRFDAAPDQAGAIAVGSQPIDVVQLSDGATVSWQQILDRGITVVPTATAGNDVLTLTPIGDTFYALGGNDYVDGLAGNDVIDGGAGNDTLLGGLGNDVLFATSGNDSLVGGVGDDTLYGGDDINSVSRLEGGEGDDQYYFSPAYSNSNVNGIATDTSPISSDTYRVRSGGTNYQQIDVSDGGGIDRLIFESSSITPTNVTVRATGAGAGFKLTGGNLAVSIHNAVDVNGRIGAGGIESVEFRNGVIWTPSQLLSMALRATTGNDEIRGFEGDDVIDGGAGDDYLNGGGGSDLLLGSAGYDYLYGGSGNDTLDVGPGGGSMIGDAGDDVYAVRGGDGYVNIGGRGERGEDDGFDVLKIAANPSAVTTSLTRYTGGNAEVSVVWNDGSARATFQLRGQSDAVEEIRFADGSTVNVYQFVSSQMIAPTSSGDQINLTSLDEIVHAGDGNDTVFGYSGNDTLFGDAGHDELDSGSGINQLYGGEGNDILIGRGQNDLLDGGAGFDEIKVATGKATVVFDWGYERDRISDDGWTTKSTTIRFGPTIAPNDAQVRWSSSGQLTTYIGSGQDNISASAYAHRDPNFLFSPLESVNFQDGTSWSIENMIAMANTPTSGDDILSDAVGVNSFDGGDGNDSIYGAFGADTLVGGAGDDSLDGGEDDDRLIGGAGNDTLSGGGGVNTYVYARGDGEDLVGEVHSYSNFERDIIEFGAGISPDDVSIIGNSAFLSSAEILITGGGSIKFKDVSELGKFPNFVKFLNGTVWDKRQIADRLFGGTVGNDVIYGFSEGSDSIFGSGGSDMLIGLGGSDTLNGGAGDDTLYASAINEGGFSSQQDVLVGGVGNDVLHGGNGVNTYLFERGFGHDSIDRTTVGSSAVSKVIFDTSISAAEVVCSYHSTSGYVLSVPSSGDTLELNLAANDLVQFSDGTVWTKADVIARLVYAATETSDSIYGADQSDAIDARGGHDVVYAGGGTDTVNGMDGNDTLFGGDGNDLLIGGAGSDQLLGDAGNDTFSGGLGDDLIEDALGIDRYEFAAGDGRDTILDFDGTGDVLMLGSGITPAGAQVKSNPSGAADGYYQIDFTGSTDSVSLYGIESVVFQDGTVWTSAYIDSQAKMIRGTAGSDVLNGTTGADQLYGLGGNDQLNGMAGADWLDGGLGADTMKGSAGDDTYVVDDIGDVVVESSSQGNDKVFSSVTHTLASNVEYLELTGNAAINGTGNSLANIISGNAAANIISGGTGADTLIGGLGDDTYLVDSAGDVVTEGSTEGVDLVQSSVTYALSSSVENLALTGSSAINGTGNGLDNVLTGNSANNTLTGAAGNDTLDGGLGNDTMVGGTGNDTYVVNVSTDVVTENASEGTDTVQSSVTLTLANNVENLVLTGVSAINGTGNTLANTLTGNAAINTLSGGTGNDTMIGGAGDDIYVVEATGDVITENSGEGIDLVQSSVSFTLANNIEKLTLTGTSVINGTGNALDNALTGNGVANTLTGGAGNDTLDGGVGTDTMIGGSGNDVYLLNVAADVVTETANDGIDTVQIGVTYSLGSNVENLALTGSTAVNGTGNGLDNVLSGNTANNTLTGAAGNDTLDGGAGNDIMVGGTGNDTYVVNVATDVVTENANEGTDTVQTAITYTLGNNLENLTLLGSTALNGTGNALNNVLTGNSAANTLTGAAGSDTLDGGLGVDTLIGGLAADTYVFGAGYGIDTVQENDSTAGIKDVVSFGAGIGTGDIHFLQTGNDLNAMLRNTSDKLVIKDWYLGSQYRVEEFRFSDGSVLTDIQAQALVGAMAAFNPPSAATQGTVLHSRLPSNAGLFAVSAIQ